MNQPKPAKSGLALAALIIGIIALLLSAVPIINNFAFILALAALVLGIVGLIETKKKDKSGRGKAVAAIILSIVAGIIVVISQMVYYAALDGASKALDEASSEFKESADKATGDATDELLKNDVTVVIGTFAATVGEYDVVTTELPITVTNKNAEKKSYSIQIEAVDANGTRIADETVYANDLGAGQTQTFKAFAYVASDKLEAMKAATFKIVSVSQY